MLKPSSDAFSQAAEVALGWIVPRSQRDELLAALGDFGFHAHWRNAVAEPHGVALRDTSAVIIKHNKSLHANAGGRSQVVNSGAPDRPRR